MQVLTIPDIHLKPWIFDKADQILHSKKYLIDQIVCLGDLPDDWGYKNDKATYHKTFERAITFAKVHPAMLWCLGNHEASYLWNFDQSGKAYGARQEAINGIKALLAAVPLTHFEIIHRIDDVLFSHAGLSKSFIQDYLCKNYYRFSTDDIIHKINHTLPPEVFWTDASPLWLRPFFNHQTGKYYYESLYRPKTYFQVVGHTPVDNITQVDNVLICDTFSTTSEHRPIGTQDFCLIDTKTHQWQSIKI